MPGRAVRSSAQSSASSKTFRSKAQKRNLDAYAIASHQTKEKKPVRASRLGEVVDDGPRKKRRRTDGDDEDDEDNPESDGEHASRSSKRRRSANDDDEMEQGSDSEGNEWTLGGLASDDEDSDLDSDEAFGESDEERFEGFTFRGSSSAQPRKTKKTRSLRNTGALGRTLDLNEDDFDQDEDSILEEEGVDLATMLDDDIDAGEQSGHNRRPSQRDSPSEISEQDDEAEEDEDEDESSGSGTDRDLNIDSDEDDEGDDEERVARLHQRLISLNDTVVDKNVVSQIGEALSVDDLLADLDPSIRKQFSAAIKTKKRSERPKTLAVPLPKRQQDKLDREVASQKAKEQLDRWRDTVIQNRRADFLSFPLKDPDGADRVNTDKFTDDGKPKNQLEESIRKILEESGMVSGAKEDPHVDDEDMLLKAEALEAKKLPVEEVLRRRAELRMNRELLFREEIKAKRIAKIKSKAYRRVHRRERERQHELEREAREAGGLDGLDEDEKERADRLRAEERMSTKHRNSKWAKTLRATNRTVWDENARDGVVEQAKRQEELRRRIAGESIEHEDDNGVSGDDSEFEDGTDDDRDASLVRQLANASRNEADGQNHKLQKLKFMQAAEERRRKQNNEDIERLRKELAVADGDESEIDGEIDDYGLGRAVFGPGAQKTADSMQILPRPEFEEGHVSDEEDRMERKNDTPAVYAAQKRDASIPGARDKKQNVHSDKLGVSQQMQPNISWIAASTSRQTEDGKEDQPRPKSKKEQQRSRMLNDVATLDLNISQPPKSDRTKTAKPLATRQGTLETKHSDAGDTSGWIVVNRKSSNSDDGASDDDFSVSEAGQDGALSKKPSYQARAFAGDDVEAAFEAEKADAVASEDEKEVSTHLPGWGSWTGDGLSKKVRKANVRQRHNPLFKHKLAGVKPSDRKDAKLANVIISEKKDAQGGGKKNSKYLTPVLPHEFERKDQYERSLRLPVGPEWTTKETFQRSTRPRVVIKPGTVIEAMRKPLV